MDDMDIFEKVQQWLKANTVPDPGNERLLWVDIETPGLDLHKHPVLEIGAIVTDQYGFVVGAPFESLVAYEGIQPGRMRERAEDFVKTMHDQSGLWEDYDEMLRTQFKAHLLPEVEDMFTDWLGSHFGDVGSREIAKQPLAGSSVNFDRTRLIEYFPAAAEAYLHYRVIDISTLKELARRLNRDVYERSQQAYMFGGKVHRPIPDLIDSIEEYKFYLAEFLWTEENAQALGEMTFTPREVTE